MTTNNHPAHGPVSLDRLHQISEILSKAAAQSDGGNLGYAMADAVKVIDVAIAAFGAEPVIVVGDDGADALSYRRLIQSFAPGTKLYTAPPSPVVPSAQNWEELCRKYPGMSIGDAIIRAAGWNLCRYTMLQGKSEPANQNDEFPLDYLQGQKDGLEWAAQLAEANHPQTGDWLYDDPIELARAIRKGPDMPTSQAGNFREIPNSSTNEHVRHEYRASDEQVVLREYRTNHSVWIQCSKQAYERRKAEGCEVRELYEQPQNKQQNIPENIPGMREAVIAIRNSGIDIDAEKILAERDSFNSPVAPDGWIPVSERMPERDIDVQVYCADKKEQMVGYLERNEAEGWFRFASLPNGGGVYCKPTHWMPLPAAPQQEVKSALEHGMQRYAGAMQKLSEGDD